MQPGGGEHGCRHQGNPPAAGHRGHHRGTPSPSHPSPPFPSTETSSSEEQQKHENQPTVSLPEGPLVEILSRVPNKSLCRFKCVSKPWLALCSDPEIRKRCPHSLIGFFDLGGFGHIKFRNLSGRGPPLVDPSLPFLRHSYEDITIHQCSSSLLLCQCRKSTSDVDKCDYVVCNPATEKWTVLPPIVLWDQGDSQFYSRTFRIFFLGASSSRFVVFAPVSTYLGISADVAIYSSETGRWAFVQSACNSETFMFAHREGVFLNGAMHLIVDNSSLAAIDAEGKVWWRIEVPRITPSSYDNAVPSIGHSQGRLYAWRIDNAHDCQLYVWVLEDYDTGKWTLKHTVNVLELFGRHCPEGTESYKMFAIHPECNLICLTDGEEMTVSYNMDNQNVHVICTSGEFLGGLPYTPCFAEWPSNGH